MRTRSWDAFALDVLVDSWAPVVAAALRLSPGAVRVEAGLQEAGPGRLARAGTHGILQEASAASGLQPPRLPFSSVLRKLPSTSVPEPIFLPPRG